MLKVYTYNIILYDVCRLTRSLHQIDANYILMLYNIP